MTSTSSSHKYVLSSVYLPGTVLGYGDTSVDKTDSPLTSRWPWTNIEDRIFLLIFFTDRKGEE